VRKIYKALDPAAGMQEAAASAQNRQEWRQREVQFIADDAR